MVQAFVELPIESLDNVFLSLQSVFQCIMMNGDGNAFKLPHIGKAGLRREGNLPESIDCNIEAIEYAMESLYNPNQE